MKRTEILKEIEIKEKNRDFNSNVQPPNQKIKKVTKDYDYLQKGVLKKAVSLVSLPIFNFASWLFSNHFKLKIVGRENIKNLKNSGAMITCNHIHDLDCTLIKKATKGKKLNIIVAEFNNYRGVFGALLRSAGTLPLSDSPTCMKNLTKAIGVLLEKKHLVLCYPERALWWCYEKPRPLLAGAFHFAAKYNVPLIPTFFTFKNLKQRKDGTYKKQFVLHVGKPIYPKEDFNLKQNIEYLASKNFEFNKLTYEQFYQKKLTYLPQETDTEQNINSQN